MLLLSRAIQCGRSIGRPAFLTADELRRLVDADEAAVENLDAHALEIDLARATAALQDLEREPKRR